MQGVVIDKKVLGDVSATLVSCRIVVNIHPNHLLVGQSKPLLGKSAVVCHPPGKDDADFFFHKPIIPDFGKSKSPGIALPLLRNISFWSVLRTSLAILQKMFETFSHKKFAGAEGTQ